MVVQVMRIQPRGINLDIPKHLIGPETWSNAQNMLFDQGRSRITLGYQHSTADPPHHAPVRGGKVLARRRQGEIHGLVQAHHGTAPP